MKLEKAMKNCGVTYQKLADILGFSSRQRAWKRVKGNTPFRIEEVKSVIEYFKKEYNIVLQYTDFF